MPYLSPQMNTQRNSIAQAMMNVARPPPQVSTPMMPQSRPLMGMPQMPPPGAPPQGSPVPNMPPPTMPLSAGVSPQPMMGGTPPPGGIAPMQQPMPQSQPGY
jgi:hypothetical protein